MSAKYNKKKKRVIRNKTKKQIFPLTHLKKQNKS